MKQFYSGIIFIFLLIHLSFAAHISKANTFELKWFNHDRKLLIKIDLKTNQVFKENITSRGFDFIGNLSSQHPEITSLDSHYFVIKEFKIKNRVIISLKGTSLVYELIKNDKTYQLKRLDNSSFKGFNFFAYQFVRKDTLFSIGGYGFWHYNNTLTFFDEKNKGWDIYKYSNDAPDAIAYDVCGYDDQNDGIWTFNFIKPEKIAEGGNDQFLYFFDFKTKKWEEKGKVNKALFSNYNNSIERACWIANKFAFNGKEGVILVDPLTNKVSINDLSNRFLGNGNELIQEKDSLYVYNPKDMNPHEKYQVVKLSMNQFWEHFKPIEDSFLEHSYFQSKSTWFGILIAFLIIGYLYVSNLYRKKENTIFNENELNILKILIHNESGLSTDELNQFLDISKKNIDIQKNQRNQFIKNINSKFQIKYGGDNLIERKSSESDKRFVSYRINEHYVSLLKSIIH
ncbi:MAG: hypothetical protein RJA76_2251 [Bacteroidota bacterium]|jgi:hypothetical protein